MEKTAFILLILASYASSAPQPLVTDIVKPLLDNALMMVQEGTNVTSEVIQTAQETFQKLTMWLEEADRNMIKLQMEMEEIGLDETKIQNDFKDKYLKVKSELRQVRQNLRKLAHKTGTATEDLLLLLDGMENNPDPVLEEAQFETMKELLKDTKLLLEDANEKYNKAVDILDGLSHDMGQAIEKLRKRLTEGTEEYEDWTTGIRTGVYSGVGAAAVLCGIFDFMGGYGACSAGIAAPLSVAAGVSVEVSIKEYKKTMEIFKIKVEALQQSVGGMDHLVKSAVEVLKKEISILDRWDNNADRVTFNLSKYSEEQLAKYEVFRKIVRRGVVALQASAKEYLAQPIDLTGDLVL